MKLKKSYLARLSLFLVLVMILGGCSGASSSAPASASTPPAGSSSAAASSSTPAVNFPTKAITIVVPYSTGGGNDLTARVMADALSKELPQPVIIENLPGASGEVGWNKCFNAAPDGYTLTIAALPALILNPLAGDVGYKFEEFTPLLGTCHDPRLIVTSVNSGIETLDDLLEYAKTNRVLVGDSGATGFGHYSGVDFIDQMGITEFSFVPFDGTGDQMIAVASGDVTIGVPGAAEAKAMFLAGQIRPICLMWSERIPDYPDVPTTAELGYPTLIHTASRGFVGPPNMPQEIVDILVEAMLRAVERDDYKLAESSVGVTRFFFNAEEYAKMMTDNYNNYKRIVEIEKG